MQSETLSCKVITPMFSFGQGATPMVRTTELKGIMRYIYRISQQELDTKKLFDMESEYFGSTSKPSPIRLQIIPYSIKINPQQPLTLHNPRDYKNSIAIDSRFDITLRLVNHSNINLEWYKDIVRLSFYLFGMGRRARRARGCCCIANEIKSEEDTKVEILRLLNGIDKQNKQVYSLNSNCIKPINIYNTKKLRPVIQRIYFGKPIVSKDINFLKCIDHSCHNMKLDGFDSKLASPIIVSVAKIDKGYLPIYTFVKAVLGKELDGNFRKRSAFKDDVERQVYKR